MKITVIVNGQPTTVEARLSDPVRTIVTKALRQSGNYIYGTPDAWELRTLQGALVDVENGLVRQIRDEPPLFLNLRAGWVGNGQREPPPVGARR